jgi:hypothetical protein
LYSPPRLLFSLVLFPEFMRSITPFIVLCMFLF